MCTEPFVSTKYVILRNSATFYTTDIIQNLLHTTKNAVVVAVQCIFLMFAIWERPLMTSDDFGQFSTYLPT